MADAKKTDEQDNTESKPKKTPKKKTASKTTSAAKTAAKAKESKPAKKAGIKGETIKADKSDDAPKESKASSKTAATDKAKESTNKVKVKQSPTAEKLELPKIVTRPPHLLLLALMAGITLDWLLTSYDGMSAIGVIGFLLFVGAIATVKWSFNTMEAAGTTVPTDTPVDAIVKDGPYQYSRNPIYTAFLFGFIGLSFMANSLWMFLMVIPLFFALALGVIIPEEEYLLQTFGEDYKEYKKKVRRWL